MNRPEFVYVTYVISTPQKVWDALTRGAFTKIYWGDRRIESTWAVGSPVRFFDGDSDHVTDSGVVLEYDPPRRLAYTFAADYEELTRHGVPDAQARAISGRPSRVTFTLAPDRGMVKLRLVHDELPDEQTARDFREGWSPILSCLKSWLETGRPLPALPTPFDQAESS